MMSIFNLTSIQADMKRTPQTLQIKVVMITYMVSTFSSSRLLNSKTNLLGNERTIKLSLLMISSVMGPLLTNTKQVQIIINIRY